MSDNTKKTFTMFLIPVAFFVSLVTVVSGLTFCAVEIIEKFN